MVSCDTSGSLVDGTCSFPGCGEPSTEQLDLPVCDRHCVHVYRSVQLLMDLTASHVSSPTAEQVATARLVALTAPRTASS